MRNSSKTMHSAFPIGMVVTLGQSCLGNPAGSRGVVYEHYTFGAHHGVSIIFENASYDGFSERCIEVLDVTSAHLVRQLQNYAFNTVSQLQHDYERGLFDVAIRGLS